MKDSKPKVSIEFVSESKPDYFDNPPEGFIAMWRLVESLRDGTPLNPKAAGLSKYWRDRDLWPDYPPEFYHALDELTSSSDPAAYVAAMDGPDSYVILRCLTGYIDRKQGIGDLTLQTAHRTWDLRDDEQRKHIELCRVAASQEAAKRSVPSSIWNDVERLRAKHWDKYPEEARWGGFQELSLHVKTLHHHASTTIAKYHDRPKVVGVKVENIINGKRKFWEDLREKADTEAIRDNSTSGSTMADLAERDAKLAEFIYLLYRDFLQEAFPIESDAPPQPQDLDSTGSESNLITVEEWVYYHHFTGSFEGPGTFVAKCEAVAEQIRQETGKGSLSTVDKVRKQINAKRKKPAGGQVDQ